MRVPLSWLREFVPVEAEPDDLAERLTLAGLAVDSLTRTGAGIAKVVVGEVRSVREHPNADALVLVRVFDGDAERDIVCGARNFGVGDLVPLALPGARLPGGMEIGERVVRGERSDGMLCSARELQISDDHSGILILDPDAAPGTDFVRAAEADDVVFDLDVTPNRPDWLSIVGVAREVAALYGLPLTVPPSRVVESDTEAEAFASVRVEDARGCPRYLARVFEAVSVQRSPWWMRRRLLAAGMRPISNVVDVTNYVLLERGHPMHAFDLDTLRGHAIVVRRPRRGERIETLDGIERRLETTDLVICDAERPVALAGIMGGLETEVSAGTARVLLESAYFDPSRIGRTARRLGLRTEASVRFERGADPEVAAAAADRAAELLSAVAGASVARGAMDVHPRPLRRRPVRVRVARVSSVLGTPRSAADMATALTALGCQVQASKNALRVTPPSWRPDIAIEEDVIEEVARLYGYENVPEQVPPVASTGGMSREQQLRRRTREILLGAGLSEAQTLSLVPEQIADRLALAAGRPSPAAGRVANPLSEDESVLRPSLVPGLLLATQRNVARRVLPVALFEIGNVFLPSGEEQRLAWVLGGPAPEGWHAGSRPLDFFDAKGVFEILVRGLGVRAWRVERPEGVEELMHPARTAAIVVGDRRIGTVGELHPRRAAELELPERTCVAELDLGSLLREASEGRAPVLPRFPAVHRDLALVVPDDATAADVTSTIREAAGHLLESVELFDVYRGDPVPAGHVSLAFSLLLRSPERTLTDADADAAIAAATAAARAAGWQVRE